MTHIDDFLWGFLCFLRKNLKDDNSIIINKVYNPPRFIHVIYSKFMAPFPYAWHRTRMRHFQVYSLLQFTQQKPGF